MILAAKGIQMRGNWSERERRGVEPVTAVRRHPGGDVNDWTAGYAEGKRAYEVVAGQYRLAGEYLKATAAGAGRGHAWIDGFKTGWSVARDDWPSHPRDRLAG